MFLAVFVIGAPLWANAGFFSLVSEIFGGDGPDQEIVSVNSQTIALLQAAHNADPNPAKGGGDITVVGGTALLSETGPSGTMANIEENTESGEISIYVVRKGDTISAISKMFGVSANTIAWANDLKNSVIKEGQTLVILPISGVKHTVKSGETASSIAKKYKADIDEVVRYNNLSSSGSVLAVGETIIIPDGEINMPVLNTSSKSTLRGAGGPSYEGYYLKPILAGRRSQGLHGYNGVDLANYVGAPVFAAAPGEVIVSQGSGWNGGYGNYVVISHPNGTQTLYAHLSASLARVGAEVVRGQIIGLLGSTGKSTGPHLHFEVRGAKNPF